MSSNSQDIKLDAQLMFNLVQSLREHIYLFVLFITMMIGLFLMLTLILAINWLEAASLVGIFTAFGVICVEVGVGWLHIRPAAPNVYPQLLEQYHYLLQTEPNKEICLARILNLLTTTLPADTLTLWRYRRADNTLLLSHWVGTTTVDDLTELPVDIEVESLISFPGSTSTSFPRLISFPNSSLGTRLSGERLHPLSALPESALRQGLAAWGTQFVLLLSLGHELVGIIGVGNNQETPAYQTETLSWLRLVAGQLALILKNYELETDLGHTQRKLQHAYRRVIDTQADERRDLGAKLHDEILTELTVIGLTLRKSQKHLTTNPEGVRGWLETTIQETQAVNCRLREISQGLHPSVLLHLGLISGLQAYLDTLSRQAAVFSTSPAITLTTQGFAERLPDPKLEADVYYLIRQAVDNALQHAHADQILIHLRWHETAVTVTIKDTGCGMKDDPTTLIGQNGHLGLLSIKERVEAWQGHVKFHSASGQGTTIYARLPLAQPSSTPTHLQAFTYPPTPSGPASLEARVE